MTKPTEDRILYAIKSRGPLTATDIGGVLGISPQGAQQQLVKLTASDLLKTEDRKKGRGRPNRFWHLTDKGHARFPDKHSDLTADLLESTKKVFGAKGLEQLILHREKETLKTYKEYLSDCKTLAKKVQALTEIRIREGYMAEWEKTAKGGYLFIENHCPICAAAATCQGFCRSENVIFQKVLGPGVSVERTEHILEGARRCAYQITKIR
ncbi:MAG: transcriptional regulator [Rhodospirillales bacterium]|nr:transcriptional regulator [Rhodospirillales bacterium]